MTLLKALAMFDFYRAKGFPVAFNDAYGVQLSLVNGLESGFYPIEWGDSIGLPPTAKELNESRGISEEEAHAIVSASMFPDSVYREEFVKRFTHMNPNAFTQDGKGPE